MGGCIINLPRNPKSTKLPQGFQSADAFAGAKEGFAFKSGDAGGRCW